MKTTITGLALSLLITIGCGGDTPAGPPDMTQSNVDMAGSGGFTVVNSCQMADYMDFTTGAAPTIMFPTTATPATPTPRCVKIKTGTTVTWTGNFSAHPLAASGGDVPNPIMSGPTATFANAGVYGFHCGIHATMTGAVWVIQ
jgi:plastocyanin